MRTRLLAVAVAAGLAVPGTAAAVPPPATLTVGPATPGPLTHDLRAVGSSFDGTVSTVWLLDIASPIPGTRPLTTVTVLRASAAGVTTGTATTTATFDPYRPGWQTTTTVPLVDEDGSVTATVPVTATIASAQTDPTRTGLSVGPSPAVGVVSYGHAAAATVAGQLIAGLGYRTVHAEPDPGPVATLRTPVWHEGVGARPAFAPAFSRLAAAAEVTARTPTVGGGHRRVEIHVGFTGTGADVFDKTFTDPAVYFSDLAYSPSGTVLWQQSEVGAVDGAQVRWDPDRRSYVVTGTLRLNQPGGGSRDGGPLTVTVPDRTTHWDVAVTTTGVAGTATDDEVTATATWAGRTAVGRGQLVHSFAIRR